MVIGQFDTRTGMIREMTWNSNKYTFDFKILNSVYRNGQYKNT